MWFKGLLIACHWQWSTRQRRDLEWRPSQCHLWRLQIFKSLPLAVNRLPSVTTRSLSNGFLVESSLNFIGTVVEESSLWRLFVGDLRGKFSSYNSLSKFHLAMIKILQSKQAFVLKDSFRKVLNSFRNAVLDNRQLNVQFSSGHNPPSMKLLSAIQFF